MGVPSETEPILTLLPAGEGGQELLHIPGLAKTPGGAGEAPATWIEE